MALYFNSRSLHSRRTAANQQMGLGRGRLLARSAMYPQKVALSC
jgi:hypothetical protein